MFWQNKYERGDKLLYNGTPVTVTREAYFEEGDSEFCGMFDVCMEVNLDDNPLSFVEIPPHHRHLISRNFTNYNPLV